MRQWDNFGDEIDSKRNGWAGPHLDCDVSNVSNGATGKLRGALFWPRGANEPPMCAPRQLSPLVICINFHPRLEGGRLGAWMGL